MLQPQAQARQLTVRIETEGEDPLPAVAADPIRLKQVLYNLLSNAIKFSPPGGVIAVRLGRAAEPTSLRIAVSDQGPGIAEADLPRLFQPFTQLERSRGSALSGTGLGLALTRRLIELMEGTVGVESTVGQGSIFHVELPIASVPASIPRRYSTVAPGVAPRALIIDDDENARELIELTLEEGGFRTLAVGSGEEGLAVARDQHPDVIVLDVFLPGLDGWDTLRILRSDPETADTPVVMATVSADRAKAFGLGAVEHLVKPLSSSALLEALARRSFTTKVKARDVRILIVDDDPHHVELMRGALSSAGFAVEAVGDGRSGVEAIRARRFDLVLLDLVLPDISGVEVVDRIRGHGIDRSPPIALITAHDLSSTDRARLNGGVQAVLQKGGLSMAQLLEEVSQIVRRTP